ncbi:MAG: IS66 family transposase zinc-finger binding domain-containing protein [Methylococcales bacterium]|nr:IS66 family transposase zinc-finger binding domain-containing protein [Methylococcales bacterium]
MPMEQALTLPKDPEELRLLVLALTREVQLLKAHQDTLQETIRLLLHKRFGAQSEKYRAEQSDLFNEAEAYAEDGGDVESLSPFNANNSPQEAVELSLGSPTHPSAKRGRKALPTELPRINIIHELPEAQRQCQEGHALVVIGEEVSEQLDIIPAKIQVVRHIRKKYACPCCSSEVKTAPPAATTDPQKQCLSRLARLYCHRQVPRCLAPIPAK